MNFYKHINFNNLQIPHSPVTYYKTPYLETQQYDNINVFQNDQYFIPFSIQEQTALSLEKSPFGSFLKLNPSTAPHFIPFEKKVAEALREDQIDQIVIRQPSSLYSDFVDSTDLLKVGYNTQYNDINQHIVLSTDWEGRLHQMQTRKLKALISDGFEFKNIPIKDLSIVHSFLSVCRQAQGLLINISLEKIQTLMDHLPDAYEMFGVYRDEKLSAACITVNVTNKIAYYYLAGTSPFFRSQSPMVLLIAGIVDHYRDKHFDFFDLGVSSFEGSPQETLRTFKQRMGAEESLKPTLIKSLK